jgi:hypothetical protein
MIHTEAVFDHRHDSAGRLLSRLMTLLGRWLAWWNEPVWDGEVPAVALNPREWADLPPHHPQSDD